MGSFGVNVQTASTGFRDGHEFSTARVAGGQFSDVFQQWLVNAFSDETERETFVSLFKGLSAQRELDLFAAACSHLRVEDLESIGFRDGPAFDTDPTIRVSVAGSIMSYFRHFAYWNDSAVGGTRRELLEEHVKAVRSDGPARNVVVKSCLARHGNVLPDVCECTVLLQRWDDEFDVIAAALLDVLCEHADRALSVCDDWVLMVVTVPSVGGEATLLSNFVASFAREPFYGYLGQSLLVPALFAGHLLHAVRDNAVLFPGGKLGVFATYSGVQEQLDAAVALLSKQKSSPLYVLSNAIVASGDALTF
jgi:hypothetical protein